MAQNTWLFKSEPEEFSIDDLACLASQSTRWSGVRNYQARNLLRDSVKVGDIVLFYHSSTENKGVAGICTVISPSEPDVTAMDPNGPYFDPKSTIRNPIWVAVELRLVRRLPKILPLAMLKSTPGLESMVLLKKGSRLSIQPVTPGEWRIIERLIEQWSG